MAANYSFIAELINELTLFTKISNIVYPPNYFARPATYLAGKLT